MKPNWVLGAFLAVCIGCSSIKVGADARQAMQVRKFSAAPRNVVDAAINVLKSEGGILTQQDTDGGLLVVVLAGQGTPVKVKRKKMVKQEGKPGAEREQEVEEELADGLIGSLLKRKKGGRITEYYEVSLNVDPQGKSDAPARVSFQKIARSSLGGLQGEEILNPEVYKMFFDQVQLELEGKRPRS